MTRAGQRIQRRMLQVFLGVSIGLLLWGMLQLWIDGVPPAEGRRGLEDYRSIAAIAAAFIRAEPMALLCAGIAALVVTPLLRLLLLLIDFALQRDWLYAAMCLGVGVVIGVGFVLRLD